MNLTTHQVTPEEIMAWLDGELSSADAHAVAAHVEECVECASVAAQFRATKEALSNWDVPPVSSTLEDAVVECAIKSESKRKPAKAGSYTRFSLWNWKLWTVGGVGALAAVVIIAVFGISMTYYEDHVRYERPMAAMVSEPESANRSEVESYAPALSEKRRIAPRGSEPLGLVSGVSGANSQTVQPPPPPTPAMRAGGGGGYAAVVSAPAPKIARTASLTILVKDIAAARTSLDVIVAQHRGYSSQIAIDLSESAPPRGIVASLRVPAPEMSSALAELRALGRVEREKQSGEEVTQQHADLVARLQNSRETEQRLREILAQRTGKIEDVLQVEEEIARVRGEIESMEADQKALEHRVDFATIELELVEEYKAQFNSPDTSTSTRIHNAFVSGLDNASNTLLGFVLFFEEYGPVLLIWLVIMGVPALLVWRRYRKVRSRI